MIGPASEKHKVLLCWDPENGLLVLVCWQCGRSVFTAPETHTALMWQLMKEINDRGGFAL